MWLWSQRDMNYITKIHDILENAVSTWVGNSACFVAYLFNSASGQHYGVWASQFPFLHNIKDSILPIEACLYGASTGYWHRPTTTPPLDCPSPWLLWGIPGLSQGMGSWFNGQKQSVLQPDDASLPKKPHLDPIFRFIRVTGSWWKVHWPVPLTLGRRGAIIDVIPDKFQLSSSLVV